MPAESVTPSKVQTIVKNGFDRMKRYRLARAMFIKEFVGQYYSKQAGLSGDEPINLIFHTIRSWVPNLVMQNPTNEITTVYTPQKFYGELLALALNQGQRDRGLKQVLRAWIISALFGWGIVKTGIAASGEMLQFGDSNIDPGQIYTKLVDLDDFVLDPLCVDINESSFIGSRARIPRQILLDTDGYDHDLVMQLPKSKFNQRQVEDISKAGTDTQSMVSMQDLVDVIELFVPKANALVTIPDPLQIKFENYLRLVDYYGPEEGPYTLLSFTPPVPNNPFPVSPVSLWYDIHKMANRVFKKIMEQSDRQKDVLLYNPAQVDEAQDILDAKDGDAIASTNPKEVVVQSYGGQNRNNEIMLQELQIWYNYISGNPDQMGGNIPTLARGKETATRSQILQANANITIEDARDILYDKTSEISKKEAWYLHTDPLIDLPLTKRIAGGQQIQLRLTPEQRQGDFLKFTFNICTKSMSRLDPAIKSRRIIEFATNLIPALMNSAMIATQMGVQFNIQKAITELAKELEITGDVQDWFVDPELEQKLAILMKLGPQNSGKASMISNAGILQNGGFPESRNILTSGQEQNQNVQMIPAEGQSAYFKNLGL